MNLGFGGGQPLSDGNEKGYLGLTSNICWMRYMLFYIAQIFLTFQELKAYLFPK